MTEAERAEPVPVVNPSPRYRVWDITVLVVHVAVVVAVIALLVGASDHIDPERPDPSIGAQECRLGARDALSNLVLRAPDTAARQVGRWVACSGSGARGNALDTIHTALRWDGALIVLLVLGLTMAVVRGLRRSRWRLSAAFALAFLVVYLVCDGLENGLVEHAFRQIGTIDHPLHDTKAVIAAWPTELRWVSAIKFGALFAAVPMFLVSFAIAVGALKRPDLVIRDAPPPTPPRTGDETSNAAGQDAFARSRRPATESSPDPAASRVVQATRYGRDDRRIGPNLPEVGEFAPPPDDALLRLIPGDPDVMSLSCSGGGIRSAAFNLGALQALDEAGSPVDKRTEWDRVHTVSAVSGGSYIATAWVSARASGDALAEKCWSRGSREESHLRRHSSYIAPGFAGKVWAALRFLLGFLVNVLLITLAVAAVALPYGWAIGALQEPIPSSGGAPIRFESNGAEIVLPTGAIREPVKGSTVRLTSGETARLRDGVPVVALVTKSEASTSSTQTTVVTTVTIPNSTETTVVTVLKETSSESRSSTATDAGGRTVESTATTDAEVDGATTTESTTEKRTTQRSDTDGIEPLGDALSATVDAAAPGRTLPEGARVVVATRRHPTKVHGRLFVCDPDQVRRVRSEEQANGVDPAKQTTCRDLARSMTLPDGSVLTRAPRAVLTTNEKSVVRNRQLLQACGAHPCEELDDGLHLDWAWWGLVLVIAIGAIALAVRPRERLRATRDRTFRVCTLAAFTLGIVLVVVPALVSRAEGFRWTIADQRQLLGLGTVTIVLALLSQVASIAGSGSKAPTTGKIIGYVKKVGTRLRPWLVAIAIYIATPLILLSVLLTIASVASQREIDPPTLCTWLVILGVLLIIGAGADVNQWSLHPYYRDRLTTAFGVDPASLEERTPILLDQMDANDVPHLVVCAAANVADERVTAPGRPAIPWSFGPDAVGAQALAAVFPDRPGSAVGLVPPSALWGKLTPLQSLWTAVAVSGAAFSPAMGKMTRAERGLMALGNVRLGVWYPNPEMLATDSAWYQAHHPRPHYLVKEAFGLHRATDRWIYVTDGGHYENLGLVELLRRGARQIYCFDASGDTTDTFGTMAEAMRLAREELGLEIGFDPAQLKADDTGISPFGATAAPITSRGDGGGREPYGWLVFGKLEVPKQAPFDIIDLARSLPKFPNHPTTDQLYTDQKFEAYRALGHYVGAQAALIAQMIREGIAAGDSIEDAVRAANLEYAGGPPPPWEG